MQRRNSKDCHGEDSDGQQRKALENEMDRETCKQSYTHGDDDEDGRI